MAETARPDSILKAVSAWASLPLLLVAASFELVTFVPEARATAREAQIAFAVAGASLIATASRRLRWPAVLVFVMSVAVLVALGCGLRW